jgi:hypothetical protein
MVLWTIALLSINGRRRIRGVWIWQSSHALSAYSKFVCPDKEVAVVWFSITYRVISGLH